MTYLENQAVVSKDEGVSSKLVVLVRGLPSSGKTTVANLIADRLQAPRVNADDVRNNINTDLGFSPEDRITHAQRMAHIALMVASGRNSVVVVDFVCPTHSTYEAFVARIKAAGASIYVLWMDTIKESPFSNTNSLFDTTVPYTNKVSEYLTMEELEDTADDAAEKIQHERGIRKYLLRYNTQCGASNLRWRIIDADTMKERLVETFSTHGGLTFPQSTVEHSITKWNVGFMARAVWSETESHVDFY